MSTLVAPVLDAPPLRRYGLPEYVQAASPAVATAFTQAIESRYHTRLLTLFCRLVTDANAANRTLRLEYLDDSGNIFHVNGNPVTYPASSTEDYAFSAFHPRGEWEVAGTNLVPLGPILLPPTFSFRITVNNVQAGDQISRVRFLWERFYTGDQV